MKDLFGRLGLRAPRAKMRAVLVLLISSIAILPASARDMTGLTVTRTIANQESLGLTLSDSIYKTVYVDEPYTVEVPYTATETYWDTEPYTSQRYVCHTYAESIDLQLPEKTESSTFDGRWPGGAGHGPGGPGGGFPGGGTGHGGGGFPGGGPGGGHGPGGGFPGGGPGGGHGGGWPGGGGPGHGGPGGGFPGGGPGGHGPGGGWPGGHGPQQHCGYESYTEYRQVQRTREVTRYRTESRCCQSVPHSVVDHVWTQPVLLKFPVEAALLAGESEKIDVSLAGSESSPAVKIDSRRALFRYAIAQQNVSNGALEVQLAVVPTLTEKEIGAKSIGSVALDFQTAGVNVRFQDAVTNPRVVSAYDVRILEKGTTAVLGETTTVARQGLLVQAQVGGDFDPEKDYVVQVAVVRTGVTVVGQVSLTVEKTILAEKIDTRKLGEKDLVGRFSTSGRQEGLVLRFRDRVPAYKTVQTDYAIKIVLKDGKKLVPIAEGTVNNQALKTDKDGNLLVPLKETLNADPTLLALLVKRKVLNVQLSVTRSSKRIGEITFARSGDMSVN